MTHDSPWRRDLAAAIRDPDVLIDRLALDERLREPARVAAASFPLRVTESFLRRITPGDPNDPLLRQVLPFAAEQHSDPRFTLDPVGDRAAQRVPGLLQKYHGRALLLSSAGCALHCRYCFRRHLRGEARPHGPASWQPALAHLAADPATEEVILSGGDPLMMDDRGLGALIAQLAAIPQLRRLRVHSRLPVVLPSRVDDALLRVLRSTRLNPVLVIHANHPRELRDDSAAALTRLAEAGVLLLNQAVLLRGVNDSVEVLAELCRRSLDLRVLPYYLHQLDPVAGAAHFEVDPATGRQLMAALGERLPGYGMFRYVQELPGAPSKTSLSCASDCPLRAGD